MFIRIRRIIFSFLFLFSSFFISQAQTPLFKNYSVKDGLPSSETYEVFQDSKGYIWIATDGGVSRFDGYEFKNFTTKDGLPNNVNFGFYEDSKGRMWLKSYLDKLCYYQNDKFYTLNFATEIPADHKNKICNSLYVDKYDTLWIGFENDDYLLKIGLSNGQNQVVPHFISIQPYLLYLKEIEKNGFIYGRSTAYKNKNQFFELTGRYIKSDNSETILNNITIGYKGYTKQITRMFKTTKNTFLISVENCIQEFSSEMAIDIRYLPYKIYSILENKNGDLWIGTKNQGVFWVKQKKYEKAVNYLKNLSVTSILEDNEGGYWFTTLENGIFYVSNINFRNYTQQDGLSNNKINCLSLSPRNKLWLGLNNGKIHSLEKGLISKEFNCNLLPNTITNISSILCLNDETVYVGGDYLVTIKKNHASLFHNNEGISFFVKKIISSDSGIIVAGSKHINKISSLKDGTKTKRYLTQDKILSLLKSRDGTIWTGTTNGLQKLKNDKLSKHLSKNITFRIDDVKDDNQGYIWAASKGNGLVITKGSSIYFLDRKKGLASDYCTNIFVDAENIIWAGTNNGISKIKITSYQPFLYDIENYSTTNGFISNEINQIIVTGDSVYMASNDGLSIFNKNELKPNKTELPLFITKFSVNDSAFSLKENYNLTYDKNFIQVSFLALTYKKPGSVEYRYRLVGLDTIWHYTKSTFVDFTTLPYGSYRFEVLAKNNDGYWNAKPSTILFTIAPPFWHTWWFRILAGLVISSVIFSLVRHRIRLIVKRANEKTALYQKEAEAEKEKLDLYQKATDMEMRFLGSQMNPHFTFNAMNSIQKFILNKDPLAAQSYLSKYSKLIRRVLENNMKSFVELEQEIEMLELYLEIESARFEKKFDFEIAVSKEIEETEYEIPPMIVQPYVENAIWHGLANKEDGVGKITLDLSVENECIKCVIEDNGVGREKAATLKARKEHTSVGMLITTQRLQKLHSDEYLGIQNEIIDLKDSDGNGIGTKVIVYLPINSN